MNEPSSQSNSDSDATSNLVFNASPDLGAKHPFVPYLQFMTGPTSGSLHTIQISELTLGRGANCDIVVLANGVSRVHAKLFYDSDGVVRVVDQNSTNGVFINGKKISSAELNDGDRIFLGPEAQLKFGYQASDAVALQEDVFRSATVDLLTGALNRQAFARHVECSIKTAGTKNEPVFVLTDIDFFKKVNDTYGHATGDRILKQFVEVIKGCLRENDQVGRLGGEEFALFFPHLPDSTIVAKLESVRLRVQQHEFKPAADCHQPVNTIPVTASFGVSRLLTGCDSFELLLSQADAALYRAKHKGRNRVELCWDQRE